MFRWCLVMDVYLDGERLLSLAGDDRDFFTILVSDFRTDSLGLIDEMEGFDGEGGCDGVLQRLHQLKGSAGSLGMASLYEACKAMEGWGESEWGGFSGWQLFRDHLDALVVEALELLAG